MSTRELLALGLATMFAFAAIAAEQHRTKIELVVEGDEGPQEVYFDSDDAGFNLDDLEVGETRSFNNQDGSAVTVTRTEAGFQFDIDGRKIDLAEPHELGDLQTEHGMHWMHAGDADEVFVVKDVDEVKVVKTDAPGNVTIVTRRKLDEETKQKIREALATSGDDGEVLFIDGSDLEAGDSRHEMKVHIVTKELDATD